MALPRLEFCLSLEVDVSGTETAVIDVLVHGSYRHINLDTWFVPTYQSPDDLSESDREIGPDQSEEIQPDQSHAVPAACD